MGTENDFMTVPDAATLLGVHIQTLRKLARQKKIPAFKVGRDWRFRKEALLRWVEEQQMSTEAAPTPTSDDKSDGSAHPHGSANASSVRHWFDGRRALVVTGRSVLPAELSPSGLAASLILEVAIDSHNHQVLTIASDGLPKLGREMLYRLTVGKTLPVALAAAKDGLVNGYFSELRTTVIAALEDLLCNYGNLSRRASSAAARATCAVLIVDEDEGICGKLRQMVESLGFNAKTASHGAKALDIVGSQPPDVILLDPVMSKMNGLEFLEELRGIQPDLPAVIMTRRPSGELMKAAAHHAPVMLLAKPIEPVLLERTLRTATGERIVKRTADDRESTQRGGEMSI